MNKAKPFPLHELRNAIQTLVDAVTSNCDSLPAYRQKILEQACIDAVEMFNLMRSVQKGTKISIAPWIVHPTPGHWPETIDAPWKPVDYTKYSKPLLDVSDGTGRRVK